MTHPTEPARGGPPEHMRAMLARFRAGCTVCGVMSWEAKPGGGYRCRECFNVFDLPLVEEQTA